MPTLIPITSLDDPRIAPYTRLKERDLSREGGRFIAEGQRVVRRLLASAHSTESLLLASKRLEEMAPVLPPHLPVYVAESELVNQIVGFKFHSGVMAVGLRGQRPSLAQMAPAWGPGPLTLVICPEVTNTDNLGSLIRISAAFGADAMVLGERSCDPFYRQSIRVSMGTVFKLPIIQSENLLQDLTLLRRHNVELFATILADDAEPLASCRRPRRMALLLGNEAQGLTPEQIAACHRRLTIPMQLGTDSLNVSVAAGIFLYHFTQGQGRAE